MPPFRRPKLMPPACQRWRLEMRMHFERAGVEKILDQLRQGTGFRHAYQLEGLDSGELRPLIWLVGDQGVYLMANTIRAEGEKVFVVYARECNPETMDFDSWWTAKNTGFGGDDGVVDIEFVDLERMLAPYPPGMALEVELTPTTIAINFFGKPKPKHEVKP